MVVMEVFPHRIIGFGVEPAHIDGIAVCRLFHCATAGQLLPNHDSTEHDPPFRVHRCLTTLRGLDIEERKPVPAPRFRTRSSNVRSARSAASISITYCSGTRAT